MPRIISGVVLVLWGVAVVASAFFRDVEGTGSFATGQKLAWVFAIGMIALGVRAIVKGRAARR